VHAATDGWPYGVVESIDKEGGLDLAPVAKAPRAQARATSLAGRWRADVSKLVEYPGGFDGFFHAQLELTERGLAARDQYDPLSAENPESSCLGRPTPAALVSSALYLLEIELESLARADRWSSWRGGLLDRPSERPLNKAVPAAPRGAAPINYVL
jgi:hypothetical protein